MLSPEPAAAPGRDVSAPGRDVSAPGRDGSPIPGAGRPQGPPGGYGPAGLAVPALVRELTARLGREEAALPAYVYDLEGLAAHVAAVRTALPAGVDLCYAVKANPDPAVLRVVARRADGLEVASAGELAHAAAAVPGARLTFGGPGKTEAEIAAAVRAGTFRFHVESPHELRLLGAAALAAGRTADVLLRVNLPGEVHARGPVAVPEPGTVLGAAASGPAAPPRTAAPPGAGTAFAAAPGIGSAGGTVTGAAPFPAEAALPMAAPAVGSGLVMGGGPTPFGMDPALLDDCARWLAGGDREAGAVRLRGLHAHLASGLDAPALLNSAGRILDFARRWCARQGVRNPEFNLGGGMAVDYRRPDERFDWAAYGRGLAGLVRPGEILRIEPGRAVTAYCGWYVTRVLDVKASQGKTFAIVAGGTHHLRTPAAKGHDQPFAVLPVPAWPHDWARPAAPAGPVTIVGQLCTPKDVLARDIPVPQLRTGDLVAFGMAGAYAWNISHHDFLMHPKPAFHYLETAPP